MEELCIKTPLGDLMASIGGDPKSYPEIFIYLRRKDGLEIDLVAADVNIEKDQANAYLYGDTTTESYTEKHTWERRAIEVENYWE